MECVSGNWGEPMTKLGTVGRRERSRFLLVIILREMVVSGLWSGDNVWPVTVGDGHISQGTSFE